MTKKQAPPSSLVVALALPAVLLCGYSGYTRVWPSESVKTIERLETDLQTVKQAAIPPARQIELTEQLRERNEQLTEATSKLTALRGQASQLMRGEVASTDALQFGREVNRLLTAAGLRLVDEHPGSGSFRSAGMLGSLDEATDELSEMLTKLASEEASDAPIEIPEDFPLEVNPLEWMASQRAALVGNFSGPQTRSSELKLVGDYRSMVAGLEAVVDACPSVVVTSIGFERSQVRDDRGNPLIWNVKLQMRPLPEKIAADAVARSRAPSASSASRGASASPGASGETAESAAEGSVSSTYVVAKPGFEGAD